MNQKILIFGTKGWLANKLAGFLNNATLASVDIAKPRDVAVAMDLVKPDVVINAAGKTGRPNIDWCEDHKAETYYSNITGAVVLAKACSERNIYLVHLSSGCIFDGESPFPGGWTEEDIPNPVSYYGQTKVEAEFRLLDIDGKILIIRLRMPVDKEPGIRNLITKITRYPKVIDVINSVTVVDDLLNTTAYLVDCQHTGVFHVVNPVPVRHQEILEWYRELVDPNHSHEMITVEQMYEQGLAKAGRSNCVLNTEKLARTGIFLPDAPEAIRNCLREYARIKSSPF